MKRVFELIKSWIFYNPLNALVVWPRNKQAGAWDEMEGDRCTSLNLHSCNRKSINKHKVLLMGVPKTSTAGD